MIGFAQCRMQQIDRYDWQCVRDCVCRGFSRPVVVSSRYPGKNMEISDQAQTLDLGEGGDPHILADRGAQKAALKRSERFVGSKAAVG